MTDTPIKSALAKVPAVTLGFWVIKILATTLGETAGDTVSMSWLGETTTAATGWGYLIGTGLFMVPLALLVAAQVRARAFHPLLYWATIIASTTAGTTLADYFDRSLGIGYMGGSLALLTCVLATLAAWKLTLGSVAVGSVATVRAELFYWATITFSQTLGTALGDWTADSFGDATVMGLESGYVFGAAIFAAALVVVALAWRFTALSRAGLFWAAFILTRPLGATVGDFLDKPLGKGGLDFSRPLASGALIAGIGLCLWLLPQRAAQADKYGEAA
ncbi:MAG TPA: hypothetical protein VN222_14385 [Novosphingobium sp.]|nr:hypothetical protein [Novosphingobium sp.]